MSKRSYSSVITVNNSVNALEAASNAATNNFFRRVVKEQEPVLENVQHEAEKNT